MARNQQGPPVSLRPMLTRPRLLGALRRRWEQRVTVVVAGAGFGKTTLLAQAVAENALDPAGIDCWLTCTPDHETASSLGAELCDSLDADHPADDESSLVATIAGAIASRAPVDVCLVLDDMHWIPPASSGAQLVADLTARLPTNGHLVIAGRRSPPVPLARLVARGEAMRLEEADLAFTDVELEDFAQLRGVDADALRAVAQWPALAELAASAGTHMIGEFLWEETLDALPAERRRELAALLAIGGGDADALGAALATPADLDDLTADIPMAQRSADGSVVLHALWEEPLADELTDEERRDVCTRAGRYFTGRGEFLRAFRLLAAVGAWPEVLVLIRTALSDTHAPLPVDVLEQWHESVPSTMGAEPEMSLLRGAIGRDNLDDLAASTEAFTEGARAFRARGDVDGEVLCIGALGQNAMWQEEVGQLADLYGRVAELEGTGHPQAVMFAAFGRALIADLGGDHRQAIAELDAIPSEDVAGEWAALVARLRCDNLISLGEAELAVAALEGVGDAAGPIAQSLVDDTFVLALWLVGRFDDARARGRSTIERVRGFGTTPVLAAVAAQSSRMEALCGDVVDAEAFLTIAEDVGATVPIARYRTLAAQAAYRVAIGDEATAGALLERWVEDDDFVSGLARNRSRMALTLTYVLVPSLREHWDAAELGPCYVEARSLGRAVVMLRDGATPARAMAAADLVDPVGARRWLPVPWATLLAVAAAADGRPVGRLLLDALGPPARQSLVELTSSSSRPVSATAKRLLADVPATPDAQFQLRLLGPIELRRGVDPVDTAEWRRGRVRQLLGYLVVHRFATREAIADALWPELDADAAANNLRVTHAYLLRVLEPGRREKDASFFVRQNGQLIELAGLSHLDVDLWAFERHLDAAAAAERDGALSVALVEYRAAVSVWQGPFFPDAAWAEAEASRLRVRFLDAATRTGELALATGDVDEPERLATQVLTLEPWSERAYRLLAATYLTRGDRPAATRALQRCHSMLDELGVDPDPQTRMLERRLDGAPLMPP